MERLILIIRNGNVGHIYNEIVTVTSIIISSIAVIIFITIVFMINCQCIIMSLRPQVPKREGRAVISLAVHWADAATSTTATRAY